MKKNRTLKFIIPFLGILLLLTVLYFFSNREKYILSNEIRASLPGEFGQLPDGIVHYEFSGKDQKPVVLLVHGFSVPYYIWDPTVIALSDAGFGVLRYDLFGRGYSDRPEADYDLDLYVNQMSDLVNFLNLDEKIHLVGLSQGGPIVAAFASRYPDQVASVTLIDPLISPVEGKDIFPLNVPLLGEFIARVVLVPHILPRSQVNDFFRPEKYPDWETKYRDQMQYKGFRRAILSSIRNLGEITPMDEYISVGNNNIPILLLWGREDQTIPYRDIEMLLNALPEIKFHIIDEGGHIPHYEQPEMVNPILVKFLQEIAFGFNQNNDRSHSSNLH